MLESGKIKLVDLPLNIESLFENHIINKINQTDDFQASKSTIQKDNLDVKSVRNKKPIEEKILENLKNALPQTPNKTKIQKVKLSWSFRGQNISSAETIRISRYLTSHLEEKNLSSGINSINIEIYPKDSEEKWSENGTANIIYQLEIYGQDQNKTNEISYLDVIKVTDLKRLLSSKKK